MMLIYRVENEDGYGPYCDIDGVPLTDIPDGYVDHQPWFWHEILPNRIPAEVKENTRHGFSTLEELHSWFDTEAQALIDFEFNVSVYEVSKEYVVKGCKQVIFAVNRAERVSTISCMIAFENVATSDSKAL